jgi:phosphotransferase system enzyme I (PtsP)
MESGDVIASTMQLMLEKAGFGRIIGPNVTG